jgi:hypothetical protein
MLDAAASTSPVRQPGQVDHTALAAARRALERDLKTLLDRFNRLGNFGISIVPAQAGPHHHLPHGIAAAVAMGPRLGGDHEHGFVLMQQERTEP